MKHFFAANAADIGEWQYIELCKLPALEREAILMDLFFELDPVLPDVTDEDFRDVLKAVSSENPDKVYESPGGSGACFYVHIDAEGNLTPGCLIGTVLHRLGVPLEELQEKEGRSAMTLAKYFAPKLTRRFAESLRDVQDSQDRGVPWGEVYAPVPYRLPENNCE